jgi:3-oxoacyl-[acyl-carrier protein] reductase
MNLGLENKVAVVTGAARGIGREIALALAKEKVNVVIPDLNLEGATKVTKEILALGVRALAFQTDITSPQSVADMVAGTMDEFGRIDILVNNACAPIRRIPFLELDLEHWDQVMKVNLYGTFNCCQAVAKAMKQNNQGVIVNISSFAAYLPAAGFAAYSCSKAGIELLSRTLTGELGEYGIRVIYIRPGVIETEITKQWHGGEVGERMMKPIAIKRFGEPREVGELIAFLSSDAGSYINGGPIPIDGGKYAVQL